MYIYMYMCIYIYICIYTVCVCVCVCVLLNQNESVFILYIVENFLSSKLNFKVLSFPFILYFSPRCLFRPFQADFTVIAQSRNFT